MATAELCVCTRIGIFFCFWSMVREEKKKWVHLKKLFNYFVWLGSSLSIQSYTHARTHKHKHTLISIGSCMCVYTRAGERLSVYLPYTLISKLGKQIIIFVLYARVLLSKHKHIHDKNTYIKYTHIKRHKKKRNHSNVVSYLGAHTHWRRRRRHWHTQFSWTFFSFFLSFSLVRFIKPFFTSKNTSSPHFWWAILSLFFFSLRALSLRFNESKQDTTKQKQRQHEQHTVNVERKDVGDLESG